MKKYYYDLHIHSCLSPCGDDDSTPNSIAGMGELNGLDIMALTDHNTVRNCPYFFEAAKNHGILAIAGMELTTAEEIHVICLFETLENAFAFEKEIEPKRILIKNRTDIFGNQLICDSEDNIIGNDEYLLSNATMISFDDVSDIVKKFDGVCYPAHIDRDSNSVTAVLGGLPPHSNFKFAELHDKSKAPKFKDTNCEFIISSDAHYLWDISEKENYFLLPDDDENAIKNLFKLLRDK
jgi:PHP family Zn ribbon phosphoesterase